MSYREDSKYIIYPVYFDKSITRKHGRRISKKNCIDKPSIENISKSAKTLGLNPILEKESKHPSRFWRAEGRLLVDKKDSKQTILNQIAKRLD
jgi:signal recognition particle subunit SRP19